MGTLQFKASIGAKRQITIPRNLMTELSLEEGSEILFEVVGDYATVTPVVSVPRTHLPEELRRKFDARLGRKPTDIPLTKFLAKMHDRNKKKTAEAS